MMRFYLKLTDGEIYDDNEGIELADATAAEREAVRVAAEWMRDNPDTFLEDSILKVEVFDGQKQSVATIAVEVKRPHNVQA